MYGMTEKGVNHMVDYLKKYEDLTVHVHRVPQTDWGTLLKSVWTSSGVILAMPTYEYKMFPPMAAALEEIGKKKVLNRQAFRIGSYGWSGGAQKELDYITHKLKMHWNFIEPVEYMGAPKAEDLKAIENGLDLLVEGITAAAK